MTSGQTEYFVFPDGREALGGDGALHGIRPGGIDAVIKFLRKEEWLHPVHIVAREIGETRWSHMTINLRGGRDASAG